MGGRAGVSRYSGWPHACYIFVPLQRPWSILPVPRVAGFLDSIMIEHKLTRWDPKIHHPSEKCTTTHHNIQCPYRKVPGTNGCQRHSSIHNQISAEKEALKNYRLSKWKSRIGELANSPGVKSLREEIGILRMILEEMLEGCGDRVELLLFSNRIGDLVMKIEKLVISCDKLENKMGMLLDKQSVLYLAMQYVEIINEHVTDNITLEAINEDIIKVTGFIGKNG